MKKIFTSLAAAMLMPVSGVAATVVPCAGAQEMVTFYTALTFTAPTATAAKKKFDLAVSTLEAAAIKQNFKKLVRQSATYSVTRNNNMKGEGSYGITGTVTYEVDDADKVLSLMEQMPKDQANVDMNYTNANSARSCTGQPAADAHP